MDSIFDKHTKEHLREFIAAWPSDDIDRDKAFDLACAALKYYGGSKTERVMSREWQDLENRWYASLTAGTPDYTVYDAPYFLSDIWACCCIYSRKYLMSARKHVISGMQVGSAVDLGCGFGYTTAGLKELFPEAEVFGTNFEDSRQWKFATVLGKERGFTLAPDVHKLNRKIDLVFASEYFEHFENPVAHLRDVVSTIEPKYLLIANAFGTTSVGHFDVYKHSCGLFDMPIFGNKISVVFNDELRKSGYKKVETACWNDRPCLWEKN